MRNADNLMLGSVRLTKCSALRTNQRKSAALRHKLRAVLTVLGLTMGVATLITVMTIVQGANPYVEKKIANLGTNVFQLAKTPFAATNFDIVIKALTQQRHHHRGYAGRRRTLPALPVRWAPRSAPRFNARTRTKRSERQPATGQTANMSDIDTRTCDTGRYFTESEDAHARRMPDRQTSWWRIFPGGIAARAKHPRATTKSSS